MLEFFTVQEVAQILKISPQTIYNNGPAQYGGLKIGGLWRFPLDKVGMSLQPKKREINSGYVRRFGKNAGKKVGE